MFKMGLLRKIHRERFAENAESNSLGAKLAFGGSPSVLGKIRPGMREQAESLLRAFCIEDAGEFDFIFFERGGFLEVYSVVDDEGYALPLQDLDSSFLDNRVKELGDSGYVVETIKRGNNSLIIYQGRAA
jgi:hypothetical protein